MPSILVRDLTPATHARLTELAAGRGQSLQQFLAAELERIAAEPTLAEVFARIHARSGGRVGFETAVADLEGGRDR